MEDTQQALASKINSYLRNTAARARVAETIGPFVAAMDPASDNLYRNYALPIDNAAPTAAEIEDLIGWFRGHRRVPRLEYLPAAAPAVEAILLDSGFVLEGRLPLMICEQAELQPLMVPESIELVVAGDKRLLEQAAIVQNEAYDGDAATEADVARLLRQVELGGKVLLARERQTGTPAGAGLFTPPFAGVTEIAAIGVVHAFRRRGIAGALTVALAEQAFESGITTLFLMAAHEAEEHIYARAGFKTCAEVIHISMGE